MGARRGEELVVVERRGLSRRDFLAALGFVAGAVVVLDGCVVPTPALFPAPPSGAADPGPFPDGVKAGDPLPDGSVIWTRVTPPIDGSAAPLVWSVADDAGFTSIRAGGVVLAEPAHGHSVSVRVAGLDADRWYFYRFESGDVAGRVGRLRTAPAPGSDPSGLRFAFCGDQQINDSWFVAHRAISTAPGLDFVAHLGDYVYVNDVATLTVDDYRNEYRRWHRQPMLRDLHAALPVSVTWSDGEFYNGVDKDGPPTRLANAKRAWFENFPLVDPGDQRIYRTFGWGGLADVSLLDDRSYRDPFIDATDLTQGPGLATYDPARTTLGAAQFNWLTAQLATSTAAWRLVAEDYPIAPWRLVNLEFLRPFRPDAPPNAGLYIPTEDWDQYMAERRDLLGFITDHHIADNVFLAAQTHISLASDLRPNPDDAASPIAGFDFTAPSLTADPDVIRSYLSDLPTDVAEGVLGLGEQFVISQNNPNMRYMNLADQGYCIVDVDPERIEVTYRFINTYDPDAEAYDGARFRIVRGAPRMEQLPVGGQRGSFGA